MKQKPIKVVVVGSRRGQTFIKSAAQSGLELSGICDSEPSLLDQFKGQNGLRLYDEFARVIDDPDVDAVCIATPPDLHAAQSIQALRAGKHVLSEVPAITTLDEGAALIAAVRETGRTYMMAENYFFCREALMVQNMVDKGAFGELVYASGAYLHDIRSMMFGPDGSLTWRGRKKRTERGNWYPTHAMGPICRWLGINRTDRLATLASFQSKSRAVQLFAAHQHPGHPDYQEPDFFANGDTSSTSIVTDRQVLIDIRLDVASARPHDMFRFELQGTKGSFSMRDGTAQFWIEGYSEAYAPTREALQWDPIDKFAADFEHPLWLAHGEEALKSSKWHGGADYFLLREFAEAVREGRPPAIDVHDAVTWSSVIPLSAQSVLSRGQPVTFPDIARGMAGAGRASL